MFRKKKKIPPSIIGHRFACPCCGQLIDIYKDGAPVDGASLIPVYYAKPSAKQLRTNSIEFGAVKGGDNDGK